MHVIIYCSSSIDDIRRRVQDLVEEINDSRTSDQKVMDGFEEKLMKKVQNICNAHGPILHHYAQFIFTKYTFHGFHDGPECTSCSEVKC